MNTTTQTGRFTAYDRLVPPEGAIVYSSGFEFTAHDIAVMEFDGVKVVRFVGRLTASERNNSLRGTGYDGAVYGWRVL